MSSNKKNMAASVRQRLLERARAQREDVQLLMTRYGLERFLYRLGQTEHRQRFILKGAMLFPFWGIEGHRPTKDIDLLGFGDDAVEGLVAIVREIVSYKVEEDGLLFDAGSVVGNEIRDDLEYGGVRIRFVATLDGARMSLQVDIGFGDAVTPEAVDAKYPTLLELPEPSLKVYPRESVVAEKFQAMVDLGMANSRMKDFYDIWVLGRLFEFEGALLSRAIAKTFSNRKTDIPQGLPVALTPEFYEDDAKCAQWRAFLRRNNLGGDGANLNEVAEFISSFLFPVCRNLIEGVEFRRSWPMGGGWLA